MYLLHFIYPSEKINPKYLHHNDAYCVRLQQYSFMFTSISFMFLHWDKYTLRMRFLKFMFYNNEVENINEWNLNWYKMMMNSSIFSTFLHIFLFASFLLFVYSVFIQIFLIISFLFIWVHFLDECFHLAFSVNHDKNVYFQGRRALKRDPLFLICLCVCVCALLLPCVHTVLSPLMCFFSAL